MTYFVSNLPRVATLFGQHLYLTALSLIFAIALGIPLGILIFRIKWLRGPVLSVLGIIYTIPSLSLLVLLIPLTGLSSTTAIIVLVAYAQLVLVRNTLAGLAGVDPHTVEAAQGIGMNAWQQLWQVELAAGCARDSGWRAPGHHCGDRHRHRGGVYQCGRVRRAAI